MAEEDLIFGKNRHFFGGIEPSNIQNIVPITLQDSENGTYKVKLVVFLPKDTVINGQTLCTVGGCIIRRRTDKFPTDEFDGDLIADLKGNGNDVLVTYDTDINYDYKYYYAVFPYSKQGVYNRNVKNRVAHTVSDNYIFGYDLDIANPDPSGRITYPIDVMNYNYRKASMNFSTGVFDYGDWPDQPGQYFMPKPCVINSSGVVQEYLDPNDYSKTVDGNTTVCNVSSNSALYYAMMQWPKIYVYRNVVDGIYKFRCSNIKYSDDWECWSNYNSSKQIVDNFYTAIYTAYYESNTSKLTSISGTSSAEKLEYSDARKYARNIGYRWNCDQLCDYMLIQDLLIMMGKSTNVQAVFGKGCDSANNGSLNSKGLFFGSNTSNGLKIFGMEDRWGHERWVTGLWVVDGSYRIKYTQASVDDPFNDYNNTSQLPNICTPQSVSYSYSNACLYCKYGIIPIGQKAGESSICIFGDSTWEIKHGSPGTSSTYQCDMINISCISGYTYNVTYGGDSSSNTEYAGVFSLKTSKSESMYCSLSFK